MKAQEIVNQIEKNYPTLDVEYLPRRGRVTVYGFHTLANAAEARAELEAIGFQLGPNNGRLDVPQILENEVIDDLSDAEIKASREYWSR